MGFQRAVIILATTVVSFFSLVAVVVIAKKFGFDPANFHKPETVVAPVTIFTALLVMVVPAAVVIVAQGKLFNIRPKILWSDSSVLRSCLIGVFVGTALKILAIAGMYLSNHDISFARSFAGVSVWTWFPYFFWFLFGLVLNSFSEELVFRAFPVVNLRSYISPTLVIIASAILFSGMHFAIEPPDFWHFAYRLAFGIFAGAVYIRTQSLWNVVGIHTGWNFISWAVSDSDWRLGTLIRMRGAGDQNEVIWNSAILFAGIFVFSLAQLKKVSVRRDL